MPQVRCGAETLVETKGEGGEDGVGVRAAVAAQRFVHMFEATLDRDTMAGEQSELRRAMRQAFEGGQSIDCRDLANRIHLSMNVERGQAGSALVEVGNTFTELCSNVTERSCWARACHDRSFNDDG